MTPGLQFFQNTLLDDLTRIECNPNKKIKIKKTNQTKPNQTFECKNVWYTEVAIFNNRAL